MIGLRPDGTRASGGKRAALKKRAVVFQRMIRNSAKRFSEKIFGDKNRSSRMRNFLCAAVFALAVGSITTTTAIAQSCSLRREPVLGIPGCFGFVGYSAGQKVGFFRRHGKLVTTGKGCPAEFLQGSLVSPGSISVEGSTLTLSPDCRSTL